MYRNCTICVAAVVFFPRFFSELIVGPSKFFISSPKKLIFCFISFSKCWCFGRKTIKKSSSPDDQPVRPLVRLVVKLPGGEYVDAAVGVVLAEEEVAAVGGVQEDEGHHGVGALEGRSME